LENSSVCEIEAWASVCVVELLAGRVSVRSGVFCSATSSSRGPRVHSHRLLFFRSEGVFDWAFWSWPSQRRSRTAAARIWRWLYLFRAFFGRAWILLSSSDVVGSMVSSRSSGTVSGAESDSDSSDDDKSECRATNFTVVISSSSG
jgi:hypothetical protein